MAEERDVLIGQLAGRLQSLETNVRDLVVTVNTGLGVVHKRLDELYAAENQRKGIVQVVKALFTGGVLTAMFEAIKSLFASGGHHP